VYIVNKEKGCEKMSVFNFKILSMLAIFICGITGGLLANKISVSKNGENLIKLGNAFAGGIFLGAGFIHLLPDAEEGFRGLEIGDYPWFSLLVLFGFLTVLFIEKVLFTHNHDEIAKNKKGTYSYILLIVLSIHSIITGIAVGTENKIAQAGILLIAVLAHKGSAAFALGSSMNKTGVKKDLIYIVVFSLMTPLGMILGMGSMEILGENMANIFEAVFDAIAAGTFIYVAILDIVDEEFANTKKTVLTFTSLVLGITVMAIVAIWT